MVYLGGTFEPHIQPTEGDIERFLQRKAVPGPIDTINCQESLGMVFKSKMFQNGYGVGGTIDLVFGENRR